MSSSYAEYKSFFHEVTLSDLRECFSAYYKILALLQTNMLISVFAKILAEMIESINQSILTISKSPPATKIEIIFLRQSLSEICSLVDAISSVFHPLTVFFVPVLFFIYLVDFYYFVVVVLSLESYYKNSELLIAYACGSWIVLLTFNICYLCTRCQKVTNEIEKVKNNLYHMEMHFESSSYLKNQRHTQFAYFYCESVHYSTRFNVFGAQKIDMALLIEFASVFIYLATLLQFHQSTMSVDSSQYHNT
ncbi:Hypothetical predicted protein [Cloeon dipterum]|uniref:Gustatory receptor n=1 Tax=Cloeon dipterum TaxID=197152 RepID=A0A8S1CY35_9INSE|nr:Hypothetical predicted protein [Cloeon dipterum]